MVKEKGKTTSNKYKNKKRRKGNKKQKGEKGE
jgi:hypothetical protein